MFSIPIFVNSFYQDVGQPVVHLVPKDVSFYREARDVRREIERLQTMAFVRDAMTESGVSSVYALEALMMRATPHLEFPSERPKFCDRMASRGEPAVVKQLFDLRLRKLKTERWFALLTALAPSACQTISDPLWRLVDPLQLDHVLWHELGGALGKLLLKNRQVSSSQTQLSAAWKVIVKASDSEEEVEHYVRYLGHQPDRISLAYQLLQLRRWECVGEVVGFDLCLQQTIRTANHPNATPDLAALQPRVGEFIAQCFGSVVVAGPQQAIDAQRCRIEVGRQAWHQRVLTGSGVGMAGFDAEY